MTSVNNSAILYDALGNPTSYGGDTLTWNGRRLTGFNNFTYTYDADGLRTSKTVNGVKTEYYWSGNTLIGQKTGNDVMYFSDVGFNLNGAQYFYVKNLQGDVVAVVDNNGNFVANYTYDAWGAVISATGTLSTINPIRYRGYYFDTETQLYYCQQRYYYPGWGRWVSADTYFHTSDVTENNLFAYCCNNPIGFKDDSGTYRVSSMSVKSIEYNLLSSVVKMMSASSNGNIMLSLAYFVMVQNYVNDLLAIDIIAEYLSVAIEAAGNNSGTGNTALSYLPDGTPVKSIIYSHYGEYGYIDMPNVATIITIPSYLMIINPNALWGSVDYLGKFIAEVITLAGTATATTVGTVIAGVLIVGTIVLSAGTAAPIWATLLGAGLGFIDAVPTFLGIESVEKSKERLEDYFWSITNSFEEFVIVLNVEVTLGGTIKAFWKNFK